MIHFFPTFGGDAAGTPLALELAASGVEHRLLGFDMRLRYRLRLWMVLVGWPRLFLLAMRSAWRSQVISEPHPEIVVVNSDIEVIVFGLVRALRRSVRPRITLLGFIFTKRRSRLVNRLREAYFGAVLSLTDIVICHSAREAEEYQRLFAASKTRFVHVPYGLHVAGRETVSAVPSRPHYVLAAGRSGRDYRTLFDAVRETEISLHVVCDSGQALAGLDIPPNVTVLRQCYGNDYLRELGGASVVAVPLAVDNISAGQMVMLQAMAFGKPLVVTRTTTIEEYVSDGVEALLVPRMDKDVLRAILTRLLASPEERRAMGARGLRAYEDRFSMRAFVSHLLAAIRVD